MGKTESLEEKDEKCLIIFDFRFNKIMSEKGKLVTGGFESNIFPYLKKEEKSSMCRQLMLGSCMRNEFNYVLGSLDYVLAERQKTTVFGIPIRNYMIIVLLTLCVDHDLYAKVTTTDFEAHLQRQ